tara:strand:- start:1 stop:231 length:231 start_codon:yes stop_codon:yes gene_type:complete
MQSKVEINSDRSICTSNGCAAALFWVEPDNFLTGFCRLFWQGQDGGRLIVKVSSSKLAGPDQQAIIFITLSNAQVQ